MIFRTIVLFSFVSFLNLSFGKYLPLVSEGKMPAAFKGQYFTPGLIAANADVEGYYFPNDKDRAEYHINGALMLRDLSLSGNVIWGDPISKALQEVADEISFNNDFEIKPKVYLFRSTSVNAFATYGSNIFFTTALVAKASNFYELIFILGHEMAHLKNNDSHAKFMKRKEIIKKVKRPGFFGGRYKAAQEMSDNLSNYSKSKEIIADRMGYKFYSKLNYPEEHTNGALHTIEDSRKDPIFNLPKDAADSIMLELPGFSINRHDIRPFKKLQAKWSSTHPEFVVRYEELDKMSATGGETLKTRSKVDFSALNKIAHNETLYGYLLNNEYFKIVAFYHLADKNKCDKEFINFLYAQSLYTLLKLKIAFIETRSNYDPNKIIVEFGGPLEPWLEMLEPNEMIGPERPFKEYFKEMTVSDLWYETTEAILNSTKEADYFYHPLLFTDCLSIYDSLENKFTEEVSKNEFSEVKSELNLALQTVKAKYGSSDNQEPIIFIDGYSNYDSDQSQTTTDFDKIDKAFFEEIKTLNQELNRSTNLTSHQKYTNTQEYNTYISQRRLVTRRHDMSYLDSYACFDPNEQYTIHNLAETISIENFYKGSEFFTTHVNFNSGEIELIKKLESKAEGDNWKKWNKLLLEYYKGIAVE